LLNNTKAINHTSVFPKQQAMQTYLRSYALQQ